MILKQISDTQLILTKLNYGVVLALKNGRNSISIPLNPDEMLFIADKLKEVYRLALASDDSLSKSEIRTIAKNAVNKRREDKK